MEPDFDLIIVGAGCIGMAMAYQARKNGKKCLLLQKQKIGDKSRYWSSSFSARQNRVQYTESYLTKYVIESNSYWGQLQSQAQKFGYQKYKFRYIQGGLWFGNKNVSSSQGNIFESNAVLEKLSIKRLYMESLISSQPTFFRNFQFNKKNKSDTWAGLLQEDGGSINMESSYNYFKEYATTTCWGIQNHPVQIADEAILLEYRKIGNQNHELKYSKQGKILSANTKKIFICCGIETGDIVNSIFNGGTVLAEQSMVEEYVASYFQIKQGKDQMFNSEKFPTWIQFLEESFNIGYGFPYHDWDCPIQGKKTIKIGTMASDKLSTGQQPPKNMTVSNDDHRVKEAIRYVGTYMCNLEPQPVVNYRCPVVFYNARETICDYMNRVEKDIVIQTGGWIGKYYPFLSSSAYKLLFNFESLIETQPKSRKQIQRQFLNRTSYPIRLRVETLLTSTLSKNQQKVYDTIIVGAGASGLYSAYRILANDPNHKVAIFDMLDRISGRLWSIKFQGSDTPMQLGGMRYIQQHHKLLTHYIKKLHMPVLDFQMQGSPMQNYLLHAYFRNDRYRQNEWQQLQKADQKLYTAYRIEDNLIGMTAFQMICYSTYMIFTSSYNKTARNVLDSKRGQGYFQKHVFKEKVKGSNWVNYNFSLNLEDWNIIKPHLNYKLHKLGDPDPYKAQPNDKYLRPLYKFGFQNIIENQLSHEAYSFISEQNGYFSNTSNASYLDQVMTYLIDFGANITYKTLADGFDMFCYNLANTLLQGDNNINKNGGIFLENQLTNIQCGGQKAKYLLTFKDKKECTVSSSYANKIILGMPRRSIEILYNKIDILQKKLTNYHVNSKTANLSSAIEPKSLGDLINSTQNMPAIKIIMNFTQNWWDVGRSKKEDLRQYRSVENMRGVSATDLPLRQCLYFGTNTDNFLLASYNDMITTQYWDVLNKNFDEFVPNITGNIQTTQQEVKQQFKLYAIQLKEKKPFRNDKKLFSLTRETRSKYDNVAPATNELVMQVVRQLSLLHGKNVQMNWVKQAMYQNWGNDPFGGGYHNWFSGYDIEAVMKAVRRPWKEEDIFIVGEAYSNLTGWVEGALQTSQHMLIDQYDCPQSIPGSYIGY